MSNPRLVGLAIAEGHDSCLPKQYAIQVPVEEIAPLDFREFAGPDFVEIEMTDFASAAGRESCPQDKAGVMTTSLQYSYSTALTYLTAMITNLIDGMPLFLSWFEDKASVCYAALFQPRKPAQESGLWMEDLLDDEEKPNWGRERDSHPQ